jgi:PAS domain S-box-containing protein
VRPTRPATSDSESAGAAEQGRTSVLAAARRIAVFCKDDRLLLTQAVEHLGDGLRAGDKVVAIVNPSRVQRLLSLLTSKGHSVERLQLAAQLVVVDAHEVLGGFSSDDAGAMESLEERVAELVADNLECLGEGQLLYVYNELPAALWERGARLAAVEAEGVWKALQRCHGERLRGSHAIAGFFKSSHPAGVHTSQLASTPPSAEELAQRADIEEAFGEALAKSRTALRSARRSEELLSDFVENGALGLHRVSANGTILWANRAELELLGYSSEEYIGHSIAEFHADAATIQDILARLTRGETLHSYEARLRAKDGSIKHVLITSSVYRRENDFVHTRCFTRDVTDRRRAQDELRGSNERLQRIADALPVLISVVDADLRYEFVNATYERWFGIPKKDILGEHVKDVLGAAAFARAAPHLASALSGTTSSYEADLPYLHGGARSVLATYLPNFDPKSGELAGYIGLVSDVSERKQLEALRAAAARRAEKLLKITAAVADAVSSAQVFEAIVDHVAEGIQASSAGLWLFDSSDNVARLARATGYSDQARLQLELLPLDTTPSVPLLDALRTGAPVWIPSQAALLERYPHLRSIASEGRSYRIACLPLLVERHVVGVLGITIEEPGDASEDERDFLLLVARYASQAILRLRLLEAEQQSRREATAAAGRLGVLNRISRVFAETDLALGPRLSAVAAELSTVLESCINIVLLNAPGVLELAAVHHPIPEANALLQDLATSTPLLVAEGITGSIAASGESTLIPSIDSALVAEGTPAAYRDFLHRFPPYAMMGAPLRARGRIIGVVTATRIHARQTYAADDLQLLEELGERASLGIENSRLYEQAVDARSRAEQLYRFAQAVVEADGLEMVFDAAFVAIERALGTKRAAILRVDSAGAMRFKAWRGLSDAYRFAVAGHNPWRADDPAPAPVLVPDAQSEPSLAAYRELFQVERIGALAFVPLVSSGRLLGKFMLYYDTPHAFGRADIETARAIANHLASVTLRYETVATLQETVRNNELLAGVLAHDLRNPLAAMMTAAHLLLANDHDATLSPWNAKALSKILSSGSRMKAMIEQLLDFTRARSGGGIGVDPKETNLAELAEQALEELELTHPTWRLDRQVVGDPIGCWDPDRMLQVISNLATNAGQHGHAGGAVRVTVDGTQAERVILDVHNQGVIAAVQPQELFNPFRSFGQPRSRSGGLGLGLFIVREIVKAHGGTVEVVSSEADGTSFIATLPRRSR